MDKVNEMTNVVHTQCTPAVLSFCPGLRGLERGFERAVGRVRVVAYVEIEAFIAANLVAEMEQGKLDAAPVWSNIKTFNAACVRGKFDWLLAGYPCQPFSNAGNRLGTDDPRHLFPYILRTIETGRPVGCFFENVEGHLTLGYDTVYQSLRAMGYRVEAGIYSAEEAGAPHQRNRLFILAIREDQLAHTSNCRCSTGGNNWQERCLSRNLGLTQKDKPKWQRWQRGAEQAGADNELADTDGFNRGLPKPNERNESNEIAGGSEGKLGNTACIAKGRCTNREEEKILLLGSSGTDRERNRWPARPGQEQYPWEARRVEHSRIRMPVAIQKIWKRSRKGFEKMLGKETVATINRKLKTPAQSRVGCTIDGYNYREDLLRAYGNSVVEQTAEIAFIDLLQKHINNAKDMHALR